MDASVVPGSNPELCPLCTTVPIQIDLGNVHSVETGGSVIQVIALFGDLGDCVVIFNSEKIEMLVSPRIKCKS